MNAIFAAVAVIAFFLRNHYLRLLARKNAVPDSSAARPSSPNRARSPSNGAASLLRRARIAEIVCGAGVIGAVAANIAMQATFGP